MSTERTTKQRIDEIVERDSVRDTKNNIRANVLSIDIFVTELKKLKIFKKQTLCKR